MKNYYNLPQKVVFCKNCVTSYQRSSSIAEFKPMYNNRIDIKIFKQTKIKNINIKILTIEKVIHKKILKKKNYRNYSATLKKL